MAQSALSVVPVQDSGGEAMPDVKQHQQLIDWIKSPNIAKDLDDGLLSRIGERVVTEYEIDVNSRSDWKDKTDKAMEMALQVAKEKQFPWPKASNVIYPLLTNASIQFAARAYPAIVQNRSVVKGVVVGNDDGEPQIGPNGQPVTYPAPDGSPQIAWKTPPGEKQRRADGIGEHMSWQLLEEQTEWEAETDQLLHLLPIVGCAFRKSYFDPAKGRNASLMVSAINLVVNYYAKSLETAPRITEEIKYYPLEIEEMKRSGLWLDVEIPIGEGEMANQNQADDPDSPRLFLEQHRYWDLDEDGYAEPYIVTVHRTSRKVVRIVARYDAEGIHFSQLTHKIVKIDPIHYYTKYEFLPNPDGGFYSIGFGQILRPINEATNTVLNQLLDAGTLQNTGGGFIGKGLSMNAGSIRFVLGEYKTVNVSGGTLRENIVPMNWPGPSAVLFNLLGTLIESGKEIASIKDVLTGEMAGGANTPATTTLALIEQGLKVFTAIYKRIHRALKMELDKLYRLNRVYGDATSQYKVGDTWKQITKDDYIQGSGVEPVSDPTMVSDMQRLGHAQFTMQFANDPWCDGREIRKRILEAANTPNIDKILLKQAPPNPAIAAKGMELEIQGRKADAEASERKARELLMYAQAVNQIAQADKAVGDQHLQWLSLNMQEWEKEFEASQQAQAPAADGAQPGGASPPNAPPPPALPHPAIAPKPALMPNSAPTINPHHPQNSLAAIGAM